MRYAIKELERSSKLLLQAAMLAKQGTLESLIKYFKIGYISGKWHLPSIATDVFNHEIEKKAVDLFNKELELFGFNMKNKLGEKQNFIIYFDDSLPVLQLGMHESMIWMRINIEEEKKQKEASIQKLNNKKRWILHEQPKQIFQEMQKANSNLWVHIIFWKKKVRMEDYLERIHQDTEKEMKDIEELMGKTTLELEQICQVEKVLPQLINKLNEYGFKLPIIEKKEESKETNEKEKKRETLLEKKSKKFKELWKKAELEKHETVKKEMKEKELADILLSDFPLEESKQEVAMSSVLEETEKSEDIHVSIEEKVTIVVEEEEKVEEHVNPIPLKVQNKDEKNSKTMIPKMKIKEEIKYGKQIVIHKDMGGFTRCKIKRKIKE